MQKILFKNALIRTNESEESKRKNIIVEEGKIKAILDPNDCVHAEKEIDCKNNYFFPGFIDSHLHIPGDFLYRKFGMLCFDCDSYEELVSSVDFFYRKNKQCKCIRGFGWNYNIFADNSSLHSRQIIDALDKICINIPIVLFSSDYHACICNTYALKKSHITKETPDPNGGTIVRSFDGEPNGILFETATNAICSNPDLRFSYQEIKEAILAYQSVLHLNGITTVQTLMFIGGNYFDEWKIIQELYRNKKLKININGSIPISPDMSEEDILIYLNYIKQFENEQVKINTAKIYIDGIIENHSAFLSSMYKDSATKGNCIWTKDKLQSICVFLVKHGLQLHLHAIGDKAVEIAVNTISYAQNKSKVKDCRNTIAHIQLCSLKSIKKMANNNIIACLQPFWFPASPYFYDMDTKLLGNRSYYEYRFKSFLDEGVLVTCGSDSPVTSDFCPTIAISYGTTRTDSDYNWPIVNKKERAKVADLVKAYTINGAYQLFREKSIGKIEINYDADFVLLPEDIYKANPLKIKNVRPLLTVFQGEVVFNSLSE